MGSLVAAMSSYLDAKAHFGRWLLRIEDLDFDRNAAGADLHIIASLNRCGMRWDDEVVWQSQRTSDYQMALEKLGDHIFPAHVHAKKSQTLVHAPDYRIIKFTLAPVVTVSRTIRQHGPIDSEYRLVMLPSLSFKIVF